MADISAKERVERIVNGYFLGGTGLSMIQAVRNQICEAENAKRNAAIERCAEVVSDAANAERELGAAAKRAGDDVDFQAHSTASASLTLACADIRALKHPITFA
jgi:chromosome condensin MukBEF complex kleisin-like MukF subunit